MKRREVKTPKENNNVTQCNSKCKCSIPGYLQTVDVQAVEFSFVRLLQDVALLNCSQMLLQVTFNLIKATKKREKIYIQVLWNSKLRNMPKMLNVHNVQFQHLTCTSGGA